MMKRFRVPIVDAPKFRGREWFAAPTRKNGDPGFVELDEAKKSS